MPIQTIDAKMLKTLLDKQEAVLLDVREPAEHSSAYIEGASLLSLGNVCCNSLPEHKDKKLVLHCQKGMRGNNACEKLLKENPHLELYNLTGGIEAWEAAGLPVIKGKKRILPLQQQVQLTIGLGLIASTVLGYAVNPLFFILCGLFGLGLTIAGITGFCGLALVMARMPWNQRS